MKKFSSSIAGLDLDNAQIEVLSIRYMLRI